MNDEFHQARQAKLEDALYRAALALCAHMGATGFRLPLPGTDPPLYILFGDATELAGVLALDQGEG